MVNHSLEVCNYAKVRVFLSKILLVMTLKKIGSDELCQTYRRHEADFLGPVNTWHVK